MVIWAMIASSNLFQPIRWKRKLSFDSAHSHFPALDTFYKFLLQALCWYIALFVPQVIGKKWWDSWLSVGL